MKPLLSTIELHNEKILLLLPLFMNGYIIKKHCYLSVKAPSELTERYRAMMIDYPKFFKMDNLSRLGFIATEILLQGSPKRFIEREDIAVIGFNSASSLDSDSHFQTTIQHKDSYFPSPSVFVYTLPNIVIGEIAIRNRFLGETCFYISETLDVSLINQTILDTLQEPSVKNVLVMWIEYVNDSGEAYVALVERM
ncbi:MAG: hypothetical protein LBR17_05565 [Bacteroidales bacterium]|nr:hypothetical protein [Bacteroidales bacterium]